MTSLRRARLTDIPELQALYKSTIEHSCINDYSPEQIKVWAAAAQNNERWEKRIASQFFIVAESNGVIVGFSSLENGSYIDMMYVHFKHLRKGIANLLYKCLNEEAIRLGTKELYSNVSKTARPFFELNGFSVVQENWIEIDGVRINNYKMIKQSF